MEVEAEKQGRQDATAAVIKLRTVIDMVREEMEASQNAYARWDPGPKYPISASKPSVHGHNHASRGGRFRVLGACSAILECRRNP